MKIGNFIIVRLSDNNYLFNMRSFNSKRSIARKFNTYELALNHINSWFNYNRGNYKIVKYSTYICDECRFESEKMSVHLIHRHLETI